MSIVEVGECSRCFEVEDMSKERAFGVLLSME